MRPATLLSAAGSFLLCSAFIVSPAVKAGPPHFLGDQFALPMVQPPVSTQRPLYGSPNNHLERIPKCNLYFDYRNPGPERAVVYRYSPTPRSFGVPKKQINPPKAAGALSLNTKQSALR